MANTMLNHIELSKIVSSPNYLIYDIDPISGQFLFKEVCRDSYTQSSFLDERLALSTGKQVVTSSSELVKSIKRNTEPMNEVCYIFHTSFCCSTLLSRCFEVLNNTFVLREPWALRRLADFKRWNNVNNKVSKQTLSHTTTIICDQLQKSYESARVIIKPTNLANNLIQELIGEGIKTRAIVIYSSLNDFLISCLKKNQQTHDKMALQAKIFARDIGGHKHFTLEQIAALPLLEACVTTWYCQFELIMKNVTETDLSNYYFVNSSELLLSPQKVMIDACKFLNFSQLDMNQLSRLDSVLGNHSKSSEKYSLEAKKAEDSKILEQNQEQITDAIEWGRKHFSYQSIDAFLERVNNNKNQRDNNGIL